MSGLTFSAHPLRNAVRDMPPSRAPIFLACAVVVAVAICARPETTPPPGLYASVSLAVPAAVVVVALGAPAAGTGMLLAEEEEPARRLPLLLPCCLAPAVRTRMAQAVSALCRRDALPATIRLACVHRAVRAAVWIPARPWTVVLAAQLVLSASLPRGLPLPARHLRHVAVARVDFARVLGAETARPRPRPRPRALSASRRGAPV
ncbi:hypothetical protein C2857_002860 [Epichloe festucae Fl1]|uniref:Uncharacterized protein n=1 Tax=Epichloe festucae (strain Fl1) TaxID=877507 RepID=A0A7U3Q0A7_EPIFF|nr:hypothetical protein C2857_002860 [Epichloe festucae Fl1]